MFLRSNRIKILLRSAKFMLYSIKRQQIQNIQFMESDKSEYKPSIICHRGYCSIFPENTLESLEVALTRSDLIEFDILLTKDRQVIVFHDRHLGQITNIQQFECFKDRKNNYYDNLSQIQEKSVASQDWWVKQFTLQQLKMLSIKQRYPYRPQLSPHCFRIPSLKQALQHILKLKGNLLNNSCGFLIQIKSLKQYEDDQQDDVMIEKLIQILEAFDLTNNQKCKLKNFPIILQSFNLSIVKKLNSSKLNLPIIALMDKHKVLDEPFVLQQLNNNIIGVGISQTHAKKQIIDMVIKHGKKIFFWTMVDDRNDKLPPNFANFREAYYYLFQLGIHGIITQFPENCHRYLQAFLGYRNPK